MTNDDNKVIKELLEVIKNKVGKIETKQGIQSIEIQSMRDQLYVFNEKLDELKEDVNDVKVSLKKLDKKADGILEFANNVDETADDTSKRLTRIERIPAISLALK